MKVLLCGATLANAQHAVEAAGFTCETIDSEARDLSLLSDDSVTLVLLDADVLASATLPIIGRLASEPAVWPILVGTSPSVGAVVAAMRAGAVDYIPRDPASGGVLDLAARLRVLAESPGSASRELGDDFVKLMRALQHDVKNPINNIIGYCDLLLENPTTKVTGEPAQFIQRMQVNCRQAIEILEKFAAQAVNLSERK